MSERLYPWSPKMKAPRSAEYSQINIPTRGLRVQQAHLEESDEDVSVAKVA